MQFHVEAPSLSCFSPIWWKGYRIMQQSQLLLKKKKSELLVLTSSRKVWTWTRMQMVQSQKEIPKHITFNDAVTVKCLQFSNSGHYQGCCTKKLEQKDIVKSSEKSSLLYGLSTHSLNASITNFKLCSRSIIAMYNHVQIELHVYIILDNLWHFTPVNLSGTWTRPDFELSDKSYSPE